MSSIIGFPAGDKYQRASANPKNRITKPPMIATPDGKLNPASGSFVIGVGEEEGLSDLATGLGVVGAGEEGLPTAGVGVGVGVDGLELGVGVGDGDGVGDTDGVGVGDGVEGAAAMLNEIEH